MLSHLITTQQLTGRAVLGEFTNQTNSVTYIPFELFMSLLESFLMGAETAPVGSGWAYRFGGTQLNCHGPNVVRYTCSKNTCNAWWQ